MPARRRPGGQRGQVVGDADDAESQAGDLTVDTAEVTPDEARTDIADAAGSAAAPESQCPSGLISPKGIWRILVPS